VRWSESGQLEVKLPGVLRGVGDRSSLMWDEVLGEYWLISRPAERMPGFRRGELARSRVANLWKSGDLVNWENQGIVLKYDDYDRHDVQIYGMQPFRYGRGFLALVEVYYAGLEQLETQLAWSGDGIHWQRLGRREAVIPTGGEGAWDSHWVVSTFNAPIPMGNRLWIFYSGACTKHGSGVKHRRAIGLSSIRKDGWVSLEAGRAEGILVTTKLPLDKPMRLELNANCYSGYITAEIIPAVVGQETQPLPGYDSRKSRTEGIDSICHRVIWGEHRAVAAISAGWCHLRFTMKQTSFFSYRWSQAE